MTNANSLECRIAAQCNKISVNTVSVDRESGTKCSQGFRVTIADDDPHICELMKKQLSAWKFIPTILSEPYSLINLLNICENDDIILLDAHLPTGKTLDWIPTILDVLPGAKIIVITGYADTDTAIQAIRNGAFDFLLKPIEPELLKNTLLRAFQLQEKINSMNQMLIEQKHIHLKLMDQKQKLEFLNERLMESNRAFSTLAQNLNYERIEILNRITQRIESDVIPMLTKIQSDAHLAKYSIEIDMILNLLQDIALDACMTDPLSASLTTAEIRVASLIKKGLTTEMIAEQLYIAVDTVKTHRKKIRKKLNITNSQNCLKDYLISGTTNTSSRS